MTDLVTIRYLSDGHLEMIQRTGGTITINGRVVPNNMWIRLDDIVETPPFAARLKAAYDQGKTQGHADALGALAENPEPVTVVATEYRYPTYVAVQDRGTQAPAPTHRVLTMMADGTYGNLVAGTWSSRDAVAVCDALNGYPERP